ncbi:hypothetical protein BDV93DRAFT_592982 [Ceratobasidium sp. AG-I]|nr:hypothetical protein BDV93DRAFT_592982 [Ceratobasidium sp. AG-I]
MPPNYDVYQQIFGLSIASNAARSCQGTSEDIQKILAENLPSAIDRYVGSGWEIVWGPAAWKHAGATSEVPPDNVWFIAKHSSLKFEDNTTSCTYVVAIAATTGKTMNSYDWKYENFAVGEVVNLLDWISAPGGIVVAPPPAPKVALNSRVLVANGTAQAVHTLASALPTWTGQASLANWLKMVDAPAGSKIIFTGHSLGGALSPTLALTLEQAGYLRHFDAGCTLVYPTAGASPGNGNFAKLFQATFPPIGEAGTYQVWNQNVVNNLDVVPHAWCSNTSQSLNLRAIATIYGQPTEPKLQIALRFAVEWLCGMADLSWNTYIPISHSIFSGVMPSAPPQNLPEFMKIVEEQHVQAYYKFILDTTDVPEVLGPATDQNRYASYPVAGALFDQVSKLEAVEENIRI